MKYDRVGVVIVNAVKEQQAQIEAQRDKISDQQKELDDLRSQIGTLKALVCGTNRKAAICQQ